MKTILILGANSAMAKAWAMLVAKPEHQLILAGRHPNELEKNAADIELRTQAAKPVVMPFDAKKTETHAAFVQTLTERYPELDEVYLFFGTMKDQKASQQQFELSRETMTVNYVGAASILEQVANHMEKQKKGLIVGVSSVAGDRGRQSNYIYGSSKSAFSTYLQGLRNRLAHYGVHVMTVKPGLVHTPMTSHLKQGLLMASPETFAKGLLKAVHRKKNEAYIPWFWRWIMVVVKSIPENVFKKMKM